MREPASFDNDKLFNISSFLEKIIKPSILELTWKITQLKDRIHLIAVAPGCFVSKDLCGDVVHLMSRDLIPFSDPVGMMRCWNTIEFVKPSRGAPWVDHSFMSMTYIRHIQAQWEKFEGK